MLKHAAFCSLEKVDELECIQIKHPKFSAQICLQGAQLTSFKSKKKGELLWLSPTAEFKKGQSIRGGIPICWPWFGVVEFNPEVVKAGIQSNSAHGFARQLPWKLHSLVESAHGISIALKLSHDENTLKIWPFEFELICHFELGNDIAINLTSKNLSSNSMALSQALHTYLPTEDIHKTRILGAASGDYIDALDDWVLKKQQGAICFNQEVDRIYLGANTYRVLSPNKQLLLTSNSHSSIVWNPWVNKSKWLSQFPNCSYQNMLCIESSNTLNDHIKLASNESHSLNMQLTGIN